MLEGLKINKLLKSHWKLIDWINFVLWLTKIIPLDLTYCVFIAFTNATFDCSKKVQTHWIMNWHVELMVKRISFNHHSVDVFITKHNDLD